MPTPEYIRRLRATVGTELIFVPTVAALVFDGERRLLLVKHSGLETWGTVGGILEPDESPEDCAVRETLEETGLHVGIVGLVGAFGGPEFNFVYPNGDQIAYAAVAFQCRVLGGVQQPDPDEVASMGWFTKREADDLALAPRIRIVIDAGFSKLDPSP